MRQLINFTLVIVGISFIVACSTSNSTVLPAQSKPDQVLFLLDWAVYGRHAPYFTALDKGYYTDENIHVTIIRGYGSTDSIKQVASGRSQFGFADIGSLILARGNDGVRVKAVAEIYANAPHLFFCNADMGITKPIDLIDHTIGAPAGNSHRVLFPAFAKLNNFEAERVNWQTIDASLLMQVILAKQVDCIPEYFTPLLEKNAADANFRYSEIYFSDFGMNFYSNSIIASEDTIEKNPELVRRFVRATLKGLRYSFDNPEEAVEILQKYHREVDDKAVAIQEVRFVQDLAMSDESKTYGLGYIDAAKMQTTLDLIADAFDLGVDVKPEELYTNEFLPGK